MPLEPCMSNVFEIGAFASDSGAITTPHYSGYLLTAEGKKIKVRPMAPPSSFGISAAIEITFYGRLLRLG